MLKILFAITLLAPAQGSPAQAVPHAITAIASAERTVGFSRWRLKVRIEVPHGLHVYAIDGPGYEAVSLTLDPVRDLSSRPAVWPVPSDLLFAMSHTVKVHQGTIEAFLDAELPPAWARALRSGKEQTVTGTLRYQSCTEDACFRPRDLKIVWKLSAAAAASRRQASSRRR